MKITVLCENQAGHENAEICLSEWGFSALIETGGVKILLDAGHTDVFARNAAKLGVDLQQTDFIAISHYHWDHIGGLFYNCFNEKKNLIIHPDIIEKITPEEKQKITADYSVTASAVPLEFSPGVYFLGQIPRYYSYEKGMYKDEAMPDDSAIAIKTDKGAVVVSGCSHSGICNICRYAENITGEKLYAVIGGFHLFSSDPDAVNGTMDYFKIKKIENLYPLHCIDLPVLTRFYQDFKIDKLCTGDSLELEC